MFSEFPTLSLLALLPLAAVAHPQGTTVGGSDEETAPLAGRRPAPLSIAPGLDFGGVEVGQVSASQDATITNLTGATVSVTGFSFGGSAGGDYQWSFAQPLPFDLGPGASEPVTVTFQPLSPGGKRSGLQVEYAAAHPMPVSAPLWGVGLGPLGSEVHLNAGGQAFTDGLGQAWSADFGFTGGAALHVPAPVAGTSNPILYRYRRTGTSFAYDLPLPDGPYDVTLHFAELELPFPGARVFDVSAEGAVVIDDLDLVAAGQFGKAFIQSLEVDVTGGALELDFDASVGAAIVSAIEVQTLARLSASDTSVNFGAVASGKSAQASVTVTNTGGLPVTISTLSLLLGPAGTPASMSADLLGTSYQGVASDVTYAVRGGLLDPGESTPLDLTFAPLSDQYDECTLRLEGDFDPVNVTLVGLGGHEGHPFLHVVVDVPDIVVDYDGDGSEPVVLDGSQSHTHEPGASLVAYTWTEGGSPLSTKPVDVLPFALGHHDVTLEITDDGVPADSLSLETGFDVVASTDIPGVLVLYHDASKVRSTPQELLLAPPGQGDFVEVLGTTHVDGLTSIGASPYTQDVMVRMLARLDVATAASYAFSLEGGAQRVLFLNGMGVVDPVALDPGSYLVDARFAVDGLGQLPLSVQAAVDGGGTEALDSASLFHDESDLVPVINTMPTLGTSLGGNLITIEGLGFFPSDQVVVHWGIQQLSGAALDGVAPDEIVLTSPSGSGTIQVQVETPAGLSNAFSYTYDQSGPVPINFNTPGDVAVSKPTAGVWGPDGRFYVASLDGGITAVEFDDDYGVIATTAYTGVSGLPNKDVLGLTINPFDPPDPVRLYVGHGTHFVSGGTSFVGPSPYTGQVSVLEGPNFDSPIPLVTQLPTSNHDHAINGLEFDNNGDLLISVGSNTNAGVKHPDSGDLVESPLSAAILKAHTSRAGFNGAIQYLLTASGVESTDQVDGEIVDVAPGVDVEVLAPGLRNAYDIAYTTSRRLYGTDNGPNFGFGAASTGPASEGPAPQDKDEVLLIEYGNYYGSPNRGRGRYEPRENVYRDGTEPSLPGEFTQTMVLFNSSLDGLVEYRADSFQGQMRGDLIAQKMGSYAYRFELSDDGRSVDSWSQVGTWSGALGIRTGPGGALLALAQGLNYVRVFTPDDLSAVGLQLRDVHPWRGPEVGGTPFILGGVGFGTLANTTVFFDGVPATLTAVSPTRIHGITPAHPGHDGELVDITVVVGGLQDTLTEAWRYLYPVGNEPGWWEDNLPPVPAALGEVAAAEIDGVLLLVGSGSAATFRYDLLTKTWLSNGAARTFVGDHHSAEVVDGKLYLIGGLEGGSEGQVQIYDPVADAWSVGTPMSWPAGSVSTCVLDGKIHAAGGIVGMNTVANHAVYDPLTDAWTALTPMPVGRNHTAAASDGERFFVFGGRDGGNFVSDGFDDVQIYDPLSDSWSWSGDGVSGLTPLPQFRGGMGKAVLYQGEFYVFGGETQSGPGAVAGNVYDRVDVYDPATNSWRLEAAMPVARHGIAPVLFQSRIFLAGGGTTAGFSQSATFDVFTRQ